MQLGHLASAGMVGMVIALLTVAQFKFRMKAVPAFWTTYILTRPVGASFGDLLSQPGCKGGRGPGAVVTGAFFLTS